MIHAKIDKEITIGTKNFETISENIWIGAFADWALSTSFKIWDREESSEFLMTFTMRHPFSKIAPPYTSDPIYFSWSLDSPVSIDSSQNPCPNTTIPSVGTEEPLLTFTRSPTSKNST